MGDLLIAQLSDVRMHAPYFALTKNKQQSEIDVVHLFSQELKNRGVKSFGSIVARGVGQEPLDCEATGNGRERIGRKLWAVH